MKTPFNSIKLALAALLGCLLQVQAAHAVTNVFFNVSQTATVTASNIIAVTINSEGYLFTYSQDGYWSVYQGGPPTGRFFSVFWPTGVQAQAVTAGPNPSGAKLTIMRQDGQPFAITSFTARLLANTAGAGASFEIMPKLNGEDALPDPFMYDATGYYGQNFTHNTPQLTGFDGYTISLYVDFALMSLTVVDASLPPVPNYTIATAVSPAASGTVTGAGTYPSNSMVTLTATPNAGWVFVNWTENGVQAGTLANYSFTASSNRTLVANFITNSPPTCQVKSIASLTDNSATVNFAGTPGYAYISQRTTNMVDWVSIHTNLAPVNGLFSVQDNFPDLGNLAPGAAFYRLQTQ